MLAERFTSILAKPCAVRPHRGASRADYRHSRCKTQRNASPAPGPTAYRAGALPHHRGRESGAIPAEDIGKRTPPSSRILSPKDARPNILPFLD